MTKEKGINTGKGHCGYFGNPLAPDEEYFETTCLPGAGISSMAAAHNIAVEIDPRPEAARRGVGHSVTALCEATDGCVMAALAALRQSKPEEKTQPVDSGQGDKSQEGEQDA